ncbi:MAG: MATE family efflux transporter [Clostridia bacterium]|nr:MATE family efflux transporter [Clostridia bacterium]
MDKIEKLHHNMTAGRIAPCILKLALPNAVGLLVVAAYSLADSYFVSHLGKEAGAAVGVTFSIHVLLQAVGYTLGMGGGSLLSRALGKKENKRASEYAAVAFVLATLAGIAITALGLAFQDPLLRFLGASESNFSLASAYVKPLLWSAPAMSVAFVLSQLLRAEGKAIYSMVGLSVGSLLNIVLDPLLITGFDMGIAGASVATLISQCVSVAVLLSAYVFHSSQIKLFSSLRISAFAHTGRILIAGLPSFFRQGLSGLATVLLNRAAASAGDAAVLAMSVVSRLFLLVFSFCLGIGQGMMPVVGYNYGAGRTDRIKRAYVFAMLSASAVMLFWGVLLYAAAPQILTLFQSGAEFLNVGTVALRAQSAVLVTHGAVTCTILYLQAIGKPIRATILASARQGIFFLPLIFLLPRYFGITGLELTQPAADLLAFLFSVPFLLFALKTAKKPTAEPTLPNNKTGQI